MTDPTQPNPNREGKSGETGGTMEVFWLIEMQGPSYMAVRQLGGVEFYWTDEVARGLRFYSRDQANLTMMAIRQLRGDLFPSCLTRVPCAVEHGWVKGEGIVRTGIPPLRPEAP